MPDSFEFHSDTLHSKLSTKLEKYAADCKQIDIAVGFLSQAGLKEIIKWCETNTKIETIHLVCGAITGHTVDLFSKVSLHKKIQIKVYLPYIYYEKTKSRKKISYKKPFTAMMHSKIYIFQNNKERTTIVGSSNVTNFALGGPNIEANAIAKGDESDKFFQDQQAHFDEIWKGSVKLNYSLAAYYHALFKQCFKGFSSPEFKGDTFKDPDTNGEEIFSYCDIKNPASEDPKDEQTILFLKPPSGFNNGKRHVFHIGGDKFIYAQCVGGHDVDSPLKTITNYDFKIDKMTLYICGSSSTSVPTKTDYKSFKILQIFGEKDFRSGSLRPHKENEYPSEKWVMDHIGVDNSDTLEICESDAKDYVDSEKVGSKLKLKKIIGFKQSEKAITLAKMISNAQRLSQTNISYYFFSSPDVEKLSQIKLICNPDHENPWVDEICGELKVIENDNKSSLPKIYFE